MSHSRRVAVFGSARTPETDPRYAAARRVGRLLAEAGLTVCSGGYDGLMAAVSRGAREAGGHTIGVTLALFDPRPANPWIVEEIKMPTYLSRMERLIELADGYLVLPGGTGTLTEMGATWSLRQIRAIPPRPCVLLGESWARLWQALQRELTVSAEELAVWQCAATPEDAADILVRALTGREQP